MLPITHIINKFLPTKITGSDVAVPVDLQYHDIQDNAPIPVKTTKSIRSFIVGENITIGAGQRFESDMFEANGNSIDIYMRLTSGLGTFDIIYQPFSNVSSSRQAGRETKLSFTEQSNVSTEKPIRIIAPRYKILIDNKGDSAFTVQFVGIVEHLGAF